MSLGDAVRKVIVSNTVSFNYKIRFLLTPCFDSGVSCSSKNVSHVPVSDDDVPPFNSCRFYH